MLALNILVFISSIVTIWIGADLIVKSVDRFSRKLKLSTFSISFFILGVLTSIPEMAVGLNAVAEKTPDIFVGNLIGGVTVLFLFAIPILAIVGKGIHISNELNSKTMIAAFVVMVLPAIMVLDRKVTNFEGLLVIVAYLILFYIIEHKHGILDHDQMNALEAKNFSTLDIFRVLLGAVLVFIAGQNLVDKTLHFGELLSVPTFYISLIILSLGTNIPELSLGLSSVASGKKDVAFGDYVGSACANSFIFGMLTLAGNGEIVTVNGFEITLFLLVVGLGLFFIFAKSGREVSRKEGFILLGVYVLFAIIELL